MNTEKENRSKKWIREALFTLLSHKNYHDITVGQIVNKAELGRRTFYRYFKSKDEVIEYTTQLLMNEFADTILQHHAKTQEEIIASYFEFWEEHIEILLLLDKAHLLYFIEDHLLSLIYEVATKIGHIQQTMSKEELLKEYEEYKYDFSIKLGGIWKATLLWSKENPRKSPEQMSQIIQHVLK